MIATFGAAHWKLKIGFTHSQAIWVGMRKGPKWAMRTRSCRRGKRPLSDQSGDLRADAEQRARCADAEPSLIDMDRPGCALRLPWSFASQSGCSWAEPQLATLGPVRTVVNARELSWRLDGAAS